VSTLQYTALTAPVFTPAVADEPQTMDRWLPTYPERTLRRVYSVAALSPHFVGRLDDVTPRDTTGGVIYALGTTPIIQYQALSSPLWVAPPQLSEQGRYPDRIHPLKRLHASQQQAVAQDKFTAPTAAAVTNNSWEPEYPDFARPRTRLQLLLLLISAGVHHS
jgi:hypothetical protein